MGTVIKLLLLLLVLVFLYNIFKAIQSARGWLQQKRVYNEECPACQQFIKLDQEKLVCPHCLAELARNQKGELMIKVN